MDKGLGSSCEAVVHHADAAVLAAIYLISSTSFLVSGLVASASIATAMTLLYLSFRSVRACPDLRAGATLNELS